MGKGIALVYQCRYPELFIKYQEFCKKKSPKVQAYTFEKYVKTRAIVFGKALKRKLMHE